MSKLEKVASEAEIGELKYVPSAFSAVQDVGLLDVSMAAQLANARGCEIDWDQSQERRLD